MKTTLLRPVDLKRDFGALAALFTGEDDEPTTEPALIEDYQAHKERIIRLMVAEDEQGEPIGFNWAVRSRFDLNDLYCYLIIRPALRRQGAGSQLYADMEQAAREAGIQTMSFSFHDNLPESRRFLENRGYAEKSHRVGMALDLLAFDDRPYDAIIAKLKGEGFQFTTMEELGNTEEAQRKLFALNNATALDDPGSQGQPAWLDFEDFQKKVCQADWFIPAGQMVVIDTATGSWAALSAITRFTGSEHAYNLHTGVSRGYRGRKLAQAVKVLALRFARETLKTSRVLTHHHANNDPMLAIDRKLGYEVVPGDYTLEKLLE